MGRGVNGVRCAGSLLAPGPSPALGAPGTFSLLSPSKLRVRWVVSWRIGLVGGSTKAAASTISLSTFSPDERTDHPTSGKSRGVSNMRVLVRIDGRNHGPASSSGSPRYCALAVARGVAGVLAVFAAFAGLAWAALLRRTDHAAIDGDPRRVAMVFAASCSACAVATGIEWLLRRRSGAMDTDPVQGVRPLREASSQRHRTVSSNSRAAGEFDRPERLAGATS